MMVIGGVIGEGEGGGELGWMMDGMDGWIGWMGWFMRGLGRWRWRWKSWFSGV